ncbi:hypothetical protein EV182_001935, partial [Spiromyces aspiralis]
LVRVGSPNHLAEVFRVIFDCLERMKIDMANQCIEAFRPFMQATSVQFEQAQFKSALKQRLPPSLTHTAAWWRRSCETFRHCSAAGDNQRSARIATMGEAKKVYDKAFCRLFLDIVPLSPSSPSVSMSTPLPETFMLDQGRFMSYGREVTRITTAGAILIALRGFVMAVVVVPASQRRIVVANLMECVKTKLLTMLAEKSPLLLSEQQQHNAEDTANASSSAAKEISGLVNELAALIQKYTDCTLTSTQINQLDRLIAQQLVAPSSSTSPTAAEKPPQQQQRIRKLVSQKVAEALFVSSSTVANTRKEEIRAALTAGGYLLDFLANAVADISAKIFAIREHHWLVFGEYYFGLLGKTVHNHQ